MIARIFAAILLIWLLGFAFFAFTLPDSAGNEKSDAVVVLTGGAGRIDRGLEILEAGAAKRMLISGVDKDVKTAELAAEYKRPVSEFNCCIQLGFQSVDTRSNALETARWVKRENAKSIRLVTHDWHMRRARLELDQILNDDITVLNDAVGTSPSLGILFREYNKFWIRWVATLVGI